MLKERLDQDLKKALLGGDKPTAELLRGLKSAILYEEVAKNLRKTGLDDNAIIAVLSKEAKKRSESVLMYESVGAMDRAQKEQSEKEIIQQYLPKQLSDNELDQIAKDVIIEFGTDVHLGRVIAGVKQKVGPKAEGVRIATAVKNNIKV